MIPQYVPIIAMIAIAFLYAMFDVFNKREVPDLFVYAALAIGVLFTLTYEAQVLEESLLIAAFVFAIGYAIYRAGFWGAGDFFELTTISLLLPLQPKPLLSNIGQLGLPFIVSLFISTGIVAVWLVPIYYLFVKRGKTQRKTKTQPIYKVLGIIILALYLMLLLFVYALFGINITRLLIIAAIGIPSALTLAYEEEITSKMTALVSPRSLSPGDIIAVNLMSRQDINYFSSIYPGFSRLATRDLIARLRNARRRLPVYRDAAPFTLFVFLGVIISLLFGNVILYML
ncbi:MAG: prepilin peptidase [Candidatus Micrarchaeaceae archaeon]